MYNVEDLIVLTKFESSVFKSDDFTELLKHCGVFVTFAAQAMGFCPFSRDKENQLKFNFISIPAFLSAFHPVAIVLVSVYFNANITENDNNSSTVDQFGNTLWLLSIIICGVSIRLSIFLWRSRMFDIWKKIESTMENIYRHGSCSTRHFYQEQLKNQKRRSNLMCLFLAVFATVFTSKNMILSTGFASSLSLRSVIITVSVIFFINTHQYLFICVTLYFVHMINLVTISFSVLQYEYGQADSMELSLKEFRKYITNPNSFYEDFEALEIVVQTLNEKFYPEFTIILGHNGAMLVGTLYYLYTTGRNDVIAAFEVLNISMMAFLNLVLLCNAATWLTKQV